MPCARDRISGEAMARWSGVNRPRSFKKFRGAGDAVHAGTLAQMQISSIRLHWILFVIAQPTTVARRF